MGGRPPGLREKASGDHSAGGGPFEEHQLHAPGRLSICFLCGFIIFQNRNASVSLRIALLANHQDVTSLIPSATRQRGEDPRPREEALFVQRHAGCGVSRCPSDCRAQALGTRLFSLLSLNMIPK